MQTKTNSDLMEKIINAILNQNATLFGSNPKVEFAYSTLRDYRKSCVNRISFRLIT